MSNHYDCSLTPPLGGNNWIIKAAGLGIRGRQRASEDRVLRARKFNRAPRQLDRFLAIAKRRFGQVAKTQVRLLIVAAERGAICRDRSDSSATKDQVGTTLH
jgi:hypothetical protein